MKTKFSRIIFQNTKVMRRFTHLFGDTIHLHARVDICRKLSREQIDEAHQELHKILIEREKKGKQFIYNYKFPPFLLHSKFESSSIVLMYSMIVWYK